MLILVKVNGIESVKCSVEIYVDRDTTVRQSKRARLLKGKV